MQRKKMNNNKSMFPSDRQFSSHMRTFIPEIGIFGKNTEKRNQEIETMKKTRMRFTLIELLVVIAIIAILASLLMPALNQAKETARRGKCTAQIREIANASIMYADDFNGYFPLSTKLASAIYKPTYAGILYLSRHLNSPRVYICPSAASYQDAEQCLKVLAPGFRPEVDLWNTGGSTIFDWIHYAPNNYYVKYAQDGSEAPVRYSLTIQPSIKVFLADSVNSNPTEYFSNNPPRRGAGHKLLNTYSSSAAYTYLRPMMDPRHSDASNVAWADGHVSTEKKAWRNLQGTIKKYRWDPLEKDPKK